MISNKTDLPYYAVIFTSVRTEVDEGYLEMAQKMEELASMQDGFLGVESARQEVGITVSYWRDLDAVNSWRENVDHSLARELGKEKWYKSFKVRIAIVEHEYGFEK